MDAAQQNDAINAIVVYLSLALGGALLLSMLYGYLRGWQLIRHVRRGTWTGDAANTARLVNALYRHQYLAYVRAWQAAHTTHAAAAAPAAPDKAQDTPQDTRGGVVSASVVTFANWLRFVNERVNEAPHLAIFGATGSGKTTLAQAIISARAGVVAIIDPKPPQPGAVKWGGVPYVMIDDDGRYTAIDTALRALRGEVNARLARLKRGQAAGAPLTIVLDEYKTIVRECEDTATGLYLTVSDVGRELGVRLIILSQSRGVKALGISGQGDTRDNFVTIEVDKRHHATLIYDGATYPLDTAPAPAAALPIPASRWWTQAQVSSVATAPTSDAASTRLLRQALGAGSDTDTGITDDVAFARFDTGINTSINGGIADMDAVSTGISLSDDVLIAELVRRGISSNKIYEIVGGNRNVVLDKVRQIKENA